MQNRSEGVQGQLLDMERVRMLGRKYWQPLLAFGVIAFLVVGVKSLFEVPYYVSVSRLQNQSFSLGKSVDERAVMMRDVLDDQMRMNNFMLVFKSEVFLNALAEILKKHPERNQMILTWGAGERLRLSYAMKRLGIIDEVRFMKVDPTGLDVKEISGLLGGMIHVSPNLMDLSLEVKVMALEAKTAYLINKSILDAFLRATQELDNKELSRTVEFFSAQAEDARKRMEHAEEKVVQFVKANPHMANERTVSDYLSRYSELEAKREELDKTIEAKEALYGFLKARFDEIESDQGTFAEMFEKLREELRMLKFNRLKLKQQGYAEGHASVVTLEKRIEGLEEFISQQGGSVDGTPSEAYHSLAYRKQLSGRIVELNDEITKARFDKKAVEDSIRTMQKDVKALPEGELRLASLRREVTLASELQGEFMRRAQLTQARRAGEIGSFRELGDPSFSTRPVTLPSLKRMLFAFFVAVAFGISLLLGREAIAPRMVGRRDVSALGFRPVGRLDETADSVGSVLTEMGCLHPAGASGGLKKRVIFCASPTPYVGLSQYKRLMDYLVGHGRKSILVTVGNSELPSGATAVSDTGFGKLLSFGDNADLIQLSGEDTFSLIQRLVMERFHSYEVVLLHVADGLRHPAYGLVKKLGQEVLLIGEQGAHSAPEYSELVQPTDSDKPVFVAFLPQSGEYDFDFKRIYAALRRKLSAKALGIPGFKRVA